MDRPHRLGEPVTAAMRGAAAILALSGLAAVSGLMVMAGAPDRTAEPPVVARDLSPEMEAQPTSPDSETRAAQPPVAAGEEVAALPGSPPPAPVAPRVRTVSPSLVAPPPVARETLVRVAPREPLSPLGQVDRHGAEGPKPTLLHRPVIEAAGRFSSMGHTVRLAGIEPLAPDETCGAGRQEWNCGRHARTAFRYYVRGRAMSCTLPEDTADGVLELSCRLGRADPALWLVRQGWARAAEGGPYESAAEEARSAGRGIFGPPRG